MSPQKCDCWRHLDCNQFKARRHNSFERVLQNGQPAVTIPCLNQGFELRHAGERVRNGERGPAFGVNSSDQIGIVGAQFALERGIDSRLLLPQAKPAERNTASAATREIATMILTEIDLNLSILRPPYL